MTETLRYRDLKYRWDLEGRRVRINGIVYTVVLTDIGEVGLAKTDNSALFIPIKTSSMELLEEYPVELMRQIYGKSYARILADELAEENKASSDEIDTMFKDSPEGQTHSYGDGCEEPEHNTRTKITWENVVITDLIEYLDTDGFPTRKSIRDFLWQSPVTFVQPKLTPTRQQAEEKLKEFGCEVTIVE